MYWEGYRGSFLERVCKPAQTWTHTLPQCSAFFITLSGPYGQVFYAEVSPSLARLLEQFFFTDLTFDNDSSWLFQFFLTFDISGLTTPKKDLLLTYLPLSEHST